MISFLSALKTPRLYKNVNYNVKIYNVENISFKIIFWTCRKKAAVIYLSSHSIVWNEKKFIFHKSINTLGVVIWKNYANWDNYYTKASNYVFKKQYRKIFSYWNKVFYCFWKTFAFSMKTFLHSYQSTFKTGYAIQKFELQKHEIYRYKGNLRRCKSVTSILFLMNGN